MSLSEGMPSVGDDVKGIKRKRLSTLFSMEKGSGHFTPRLRSKWLKF